jgi:hypothetical protein
MFQYAMGRALAVRLGVPIKLHVTGKDHPTRPFALDLLRMTIVEATRGEVRALRPEASRLRRSLERLGLRPNAGSHVFTESYFYHFDSRVLELEAPVYVDGFWQSTRYFEALRLQLIEEFAPREGLAGAAAALHDRITQLNAVCVHVRRGDYLSDGTFRLFPVEYYQRALAEILARVANPVPVVFSDDPEWTRANLKLPDPVIWIFEHGCFSAVHECS